MKSIDSLGLLEVFGFTAGVEAADAMLKSAQVRLVRQHELNPGLVTLVVEGDLASCRAAINAGKAAAARVGMVVGSHVIGRPDKDTESMILTYIPQSAGELKKVKKPIKTVIETSSVSPVATTTVKKVISQPEFEQVITYITSVAKGRSWPNIAHHFPLDPEQLLKKLNQAVTSGRLAKTGANYRQVAKKRSP